MTVAIEIWVGPGSVPWALELAIAIVDDKELGAYLADLDELNPLRRYKIIASSIASLFEHEIKIERDSHVRTTEIRGCRRPRNRLARCLLVLLWFT